MSNYHREIDALIARSVFGYSRIAWHDNGKLMAFREGSGGLERKVEVPFFSTDLEAAQVILDCYKWKTYVKAKANDRWILTLRAPSGRFTSVAPNLPEAICILALQFNEVDLTPKFQILGDAWTPDDDMPYVPVTSSPGLRKEDPKRYVDAKLEPRKKGGI